MKERLYVVCGVLVVAAIECATCEALPLAHWSLPMRGSPFNFSTR